MLRLELNDVRLLVLMYFFVFGLIESFFYF